MAYKYSKNLTLGYDAEGKRVRKRIYANSQQELKRIEREVLMSADDHIRPDMTLGAYTEKFFAAYKTNLGPRTSYWYGQMIKKLEPLYSYKLKDIKRTDLQIIVNECAPTTAKQLSNIINQIWKAAAADGIIQPVELNLQRPKIIQKEKRILTEYEKKVIRSCDLPEQFRLFVDLELYLGLRPEETRALNRNDFDLKNGTVTINKAWAYTGKGGGILKTTKNCVNRTLPMPYELTASVTAYLASNPCFYLFTDEQGNLWSRIQYQYRCKKIFRIINEALGGNDNLDALNGMTMYTFRHSRATELYYTPGISTKLKAKYMGHSEKMFLEVYTHLDDELESLELLRGGSTEPEVNQGDLVNQ